jgi:histidyl-tRNA synthetase
LTAPLARYVAENFDSLPKPYRSYREGWVFRNEKPGPGRFRQFMQFDADTVGSASMAADAEMCMMAAGTMEALGLNRQYVVKVNNRKVLDGVLEAIGLAGEASAHKRLIVLRAIDKYDRLGRQGVEQLLGEGRTDESGDRTPGAKLNPQQITSVLDYVEVQSAGGMGDFESVLEDWQRAVGSSAIGRDGIAELNQIAALCRSAGGPTRISFDSSVVRGLEYYTGPVFEIDLTFPIKADDGRPVRFGSVGAGGRYDGLIARFRGEAVPATGFSIGVSRLVAALQHLDKIESKAESGPVVVTVFDKERIADYQNMVAALRNAGIRAELYLGDGKFGAQMKYADKRGSPCVVIQGANEKAKGEIQVKDLILGAELAGLSKEREDHLKKQADAQFAVAEDKLVDAVRDVLARHHVKWS